MDKTVCPCCKFNRMRGAYSAIPPHNWFWSATGSGLEDDYEILYCPNCGNLLPDYGELTPAEYFDWYKELTQAWRNK